MYALIKINERAKNSKLTAQQGYHAVRIRDVYATLAIKNSELTLQQISDVIDGEYTELTSSEILVIKNAYEAYKQVFHMHFYTLESTDPHSVLAMQNSHRAFMTGLSKEAGHFRSDKIQRNVDALTRWANESKENMLIKACVFHYEFICLEPLGEGSEYVARLWQMLLLNQKKGVWVSFRMPVMNILQKRRQEYYDILAIADKATGSSRFIEFMLQTILDALTEYEKDPS